MTKIKEKTIKAFIGLLIVSGVYLCTTIYRTAPSDPVKNQSPAIAVPDYTVEDWNQIEAEQTSYRAAMEENNRKQKATNMKKEITYIESVPLDAGLQKWIFEHCNKNSISTYLIFALIEKESDYDTDLIGDNGQAFGLMQVQEKWHWERMARLGITDLMEPEQNSCGRRQKIDKNKKQAWGRNPMPETDRSAHIPAHNRRNTV